LTAGGAAPGAEVPVVKRLAGLLADRLAGRLDERGVRNIDSITVEVEEAPGQSASFTRGPVR